MEGLFKERNERKFRGGKMYERLVDVESVCPEVRDV